MLTRPPGAASASDAASSRLRGSAANLGPVKLTLAGLVLIALGVLALIYSGIPYKNQEKVLDIGPFRATAVQEKTIEIPPLVGAGVVAGGALLLIIGGRR